MLSSLSKLSNWKSYSSVIVMKKKSDRMCYYGQFGSDN
jgi:hypothetical protein